MPEPRALLQSIFGFSCFRPGQEEIVDAVMAGRNTLAIIAQGNSDPTLAAAPLARTYTPTVNGIRFADWFLPSQDEATQIYTNKAAAGLTYNSGFWTSTQNSASSSQYASNTFSSPYLGSAGKGVNYQVRPVRAF